MEQYATVHEMSNQQSEKQSFPNTNLDRIVKTGPYRQLGSFTFLHLNSGGYLQLRCKRSPFKIILHPASCWQSQSCDSLQHSHPSGGQNQCGFEEEQNYRCMVAGVPLEEYAIGHEMSNQQSEKQSFSNRNLDCIRKTGG